MGESGYLKRLEADLARWVAGGLLPSDLARRLAADARASGGARNSALLPVLAGLAVLLGLLSVIAANWAGFTGVGRLSILGVLLFVALYGAGELRARGLGVGSNVFAAIGAALIGGGLVVVGQLYHTSATTSAFLSAWAMGAAVIALIVRSPLAGALAAAIAIGWVGAHTGENSVWGASRSAYLVGPWLVFLVWAAVAWQAIAARAVGLVHVIAPGVALWVVVNVDALTSAMTTSGVLGDRVLWMLHAAVFAAIAAAAEWVARTRGLWATRTVAGWGAWIAGGLFVAGAFDEAVGVGASFATYGLIVFGLGGFSLLSAYGAAPGRRWLRGAGVAGFIALAVLSFLEVDDLAIGGLVLIGYGVALAALLSVTNRMLARARGRTNGGDAP